MSVHRTKARSLWLVTVAYVVAVPVVTDAVDAYVARLVAAVGGGTPLAGMPVVIDCAHGAAYHVAPPVFHELGADVISVGALGDIDHAAETDGRPGIADVIIVGANPALSKMYYAGKWDPDAEQKGPDCYSMNGLRPAADAKNKQSDLCSTCKHAAWGSKVSELGKEGKACSDSKRLAVVAAVAFWAGMSGAGSAAGAGVSAFGASTTFGVGASASINFFRVHFGVVLMNSTMRLMPSLTGELSMSRNSGRATLTCVDPRQLAPAFAR